MHNALAAANIWSPLTVRRTKIRQIFNLAIPANESVNLAEFVDLEANLRYFDERYRAILAQHDERHDTMASVRGTPFRRVERIFQRHLL
jgi:hypothetical protein